MMKGVIDALPILRSEKFELCGNDNVKSECAEAGIIVSRRGVVGVYIYCIFL